MDAFGYTKNGSSCWSKVGSCVGYASFVPLVRHAFCLYRMRIVRDAGCVWCREIRMRDTNILQGVRRQNVKRWRTCTYRPTGSFGGNADVHSICSSLELVNLEIVGDFAICRVGYGCASTMQVVLGFAKGTQV